MDKQSTQNITDLTIILPSLNPDEKMIRTVEGLLARGFHDIIIVNDGSDQAHLSPFSQIALHPECTVLTHDRNYGKGHALKTAFSFCLEHRPDSPGVITIDGDGQHHPDDIAACGKQLMQSHNALVLGARSFTKNDTPKKSLFGNRLTRLVLRLFFGLRLTDTQTGLRAIPLSLLPQLLTCRGERYEYETNMLLDLKTNHTPFIEVPIQTIYLDDNQSSHFHPFRDSVKIYASILAFGLSSISAAIIDLSVFTLFSYLLSKGILNEVTIILLATIGARIVSSFCNFKVNQKMVFRCNESRSMLRYYILCCTQMLLSAALVSVLNHLLKANTFGKTLCKATVDTLLFFLSFRIQKEWVFRRRNNT